MDLAKAGIVASSAMAMPTQSTTHDTLSPARLLCGFALDAFES